MGCPLQSLTQIWPNYVHLETSVHIAHQSIWQLLISVHSICCGLCPHAAPSRAVENFPLQLGGYRSVCPVLGESGGKGLAQEDPGTKTEGGLGKRGGRQNLLLRPEVEGAIFIWVSACHFSGGQ